MIEIQTTIKNGLPVIARGSLVGPEPGVGYFDYGIEDLEILWLSGHPCLIVPTVAEAERISAELLWEAKTDDRF